MIDKIKQYNVEFICGTIVILLAFVAFGLYNRETKGDRIVENCAETGLYFVIDNHSRIGAIYNCRGIITGPAGEWTISDE